MAPSRNACAAVLANALSKKTTPKWPGTDCTLLRSGAAHDPLGRVDDRAVPVAGGCTENVATVPSVTLTRLSVAVVGAEAQIRP